MYYYGNHQGANQPIGNTGLLAHNYGVGGGTIENNNYFPLLDFKSMSSSKHNSNDFHLLNNNNNNSNNCNNSNSIQSITNSTNINSIDRSKFYFDSNKLSNINNKSVNTRKYLHPERIVNIPTISVEQLELAAKHKKQNMKKLKNSSRYYVEDPLNYYASSYKYSTQACRKTKHSAEPSDPYRSIYNNLDCGKSSAYMYKYHYRQHKSTNDNLEKALGTKKYDIYTKAHRSRSRNSMLRYESSERPISKSKSYKNHPKSQDLYTKYKTIQVSSSNKRDKYSRVPIINTTKSPLYPERKSRSQIKIITKTDESTSPVPAKKAKSPTPSTSSSSSAASSASSASSDSSKPKSVSPLPIKQKEAFIPPAPPMSKDFFKQTEINNTFSRSNKLRKSLPANTDEKTTQSFDAVVSELKTKLNKIRTNDENVIKFDELLHKAPASQQFTTNTIDPKTQNFIDQPRLIEMLKQEKLKLRPPKEQNNTESNSSVFSTSQKLSQSKQVKSISSNSDLNENGKKSWLGGSSIDSEQTTSNPNLDLTRLSNSSSTESTHLKFPNMLSSRIMKTSLPISCKSAISQPKEVSSSNKIISSVANSFKLEVFDDYDDDLSDDYSKYNRVKFSPMAIQRQQNETARMDNYNFSSLLNDSNEENKLLMKSVIISSHENDGNLAVNNTSSSSTNSTDNILKIPPKLSSKSASFGQKEKDYQMLNKTNTLTGYLRERMRLEQKTVKNENNRLYKCNTEFMNTSKNISAKSDTHVKLDRIDSLNNFIRVSPRLSRIAAFSTKNLFLRNDSSVCVTDRNNLKKSSNTMNKSTDAIRNTQVTSSNSAAQLKHEFKPQILRQQEQNHNLLMPITTHVPPYNVYSNTISKSSNYILNSYCTNENIMQKEFKKQASLNDLDCLVSNEVQSNENKKVIIQEKNIALNPVPEQSLNSLNCIDRTNNKFVPSKYSSFTNISMENKGQVGQAVKSSPVKGSDENDLFNLAGSYMINLPSFVNQQDEQKLLTNKNVFAENSVNDFFDSAGQNDIYNDFIDLNNFNCFDMNNYNDYLSNDLNLEYAYFNSNAIETDQQSNYIKGQNSILNKKENSKNVHFNSSDLDNEKKLNEYLAEMTNYYRNLSISMNNRNNNDSTFNNNNGNCIIGLEDKLNYQNF